MDRVIFLFGIILLSPLSWGMDFYGEGLTELFSYESSLPCESRSRSCDSKNGVMGYALDQANHAGLKISNIVETSYSKKTSQVYVVSETYGLCRVETKNLDQLGTLGFLCSSSAKSEKEMKRVDRVLSLTKSDEETYALLDITEKTPLKGSL